jgi:hypothetical protein
MRAQKDGWIFRVQRLKNNPRIYTTKYPDK